MCCGHLNGPATQIPMWGDLLHRIEADQCVCCGMANEESGMAPATETVEKKYIAEGVWVCHGIVGLPGYPSCCYDPRLQLDHSLYREQILAELSQEMKARAR